MLALHNGVNFGHGASMGVTHKRMYEAVRVDNPGAATNKGGTQYVITETNFGHGKVFPVS
jgi:hypothetical protein